MRLLMLTIGLLPITASAASGSINNTGIDWDLVLKALGFVVAAVAASLQVRNLSFAARASLKTDLEILKLVDVNDLNHKKVKRVVDARIQVLYADDDSKSAEHFAERWAYGLGGGICLLGFAYWTVTLAQPTFSWWSLLTGYLALASLGSISMGISGKTLAAQRRRRAGATVGATASPD